MRNWKAAREMAVAILLVLAVPAFGQKSAAVISNPAPRSVVVSIPDRKLVVVEGEVVVANFPISVGAPSSPTPTGSFRIITRVANPTYYRPGTVIPSGKENPLGTRWLGLSQRGYGIHGTNAPKSVGRAASHGCIRLRNRDMERLFTMLRVGDRVEIHGLRDQQIARYFGSDSGLDVVAETQATPGQAGGGQ